MEKITVKFVHGAAESLEEIDVPDADDPPMSVSIWLPADDPLAAAGAQDPWEAVYIREPNPGGDPRWLYRFHALADPEE
ncbi:MULTISPECIES: hypothetical protein [Catellatospora]|uniref:Uncharacterized protein n=2 Tax=Catellatospora TaxID=53365 RepID=A0A8J3NW85_9ACTN|nr:MULTISPECIES: hypothetical protein [Catellatospora]GIF94737.1 hypothetical protein Cch02nite_81810 [Catellatospora chokoriensis]GIG05709.1 hypothetical protein Cco03nite_24090 [Catellatospora coxensis]